MVCSSWEKASSGIIVHAQELAEEQKSKETSAEEAVWKENNAENCLWFWRLCCGKRMTQLLLRGT